MARIKKRIKQLSELSTEGRFLLFYAMLLLPSIAAALNLFGFKKTRALLAKTIPQNPDRDYSEKQQLEVAYQVVKIVAIAANHGPYKANCLKKSMAGWWLLARKGIAVEIKIGVARESDALQAHAWIEYRGLVLNDHQDVANQYSPLKNIADTDQMSYL